MRKALGLLYIVNLECDVAYPSFWLNWLAVWVHAMSIPAVIGFMSIYCANNNWVTSLGGAPIGTMQATTVYCLKKITKWWEWHCWEVQLADLLQCNV